MRTRSTPTYLRKLRLERGITLADVASLTGLSVTTVSRIERGQQPFRRSYAPAWSGALGVTRDTVLACLAEEAQASSFRAV